MFIEDTSFFKGEESIRPMYWFLVLAMLCLQLFPPLFSDQSFKVPAIFSEEQLRKSFLEKFPSSLYHPTWGIQAKEAFALRPKRKKIIIESIRECKKIPYKFHETEGFFQNPKPPLRFDLGFRYQPLKKQALLLPPDVVYTALEIHVPEGFEIEQSIEGKWLLGSHWGVVSNLKIKESWMQSASMSWNGDLTSVINHSFGVSWQGSTKSLSELILELYLGQRSEQSWAFQNRYPSPSSISGLNFDGFYFRIRMLF